MILGATAFILMSFGSGPAAAAPPRMPVTQIIVRRQIIIRTMRIGPARPNAETPIEWKEHKGPKCLPARAIAGASLLGKSSVDLILRDGSRIRARFASSCPALDYYYGFYITPGDDGFICSDREVIRSRVGGECEIDSFRYLRPAAKD